ncbi:unnamed protein product [Closterium sp. NIES-53]
MRHALDSCHLRFGPSPPLLPPRGTTNPARTLPPAVAYTAQTSRAPSPPPLVPSTPSRLSIWHTQACQGAYLRRLAGVLPSDCCKLLHTSTRAREHSIPFIRSFSKATLIQRTRIV